MLGFMLEPRREGEASTPTGLGAIVGTVSVVKCLGWKFIILPQSAVLENRCPKKLEKYKNEQKLGSIDHIGKAESKKETCINVKPD
jgi:hypothetical protein